MRKEIRSHLQFKDVEKIYIDTDGIKKKAIYIGAEPVDSNYANDPNAHDIGKPFSPIILRVY